ncbi:MAG: hypothetical protein ACFNW0_01765 [Fretibacterium sp.]
MEDRYVLMSGTREFDEVIRGTAAECLERYFEAMGYGFRIEPDEGPYWLYALNTAGGEENWEEYDQVGWAGSHRTIDGLTGAFWTLLEGKTKGHAAKGSRGDLPPWPQRKGI